MADEEKVEEWADKGSETNLFRQALDAHSNEDEPNYLGDKKVVESILRLAAFEAFSALPEAVENNTVEEMLMRVGMDRMPAFFGVDGHKEVRGFNEPGGVDVFVAKWCGVDSDKPTERLVGGFLAMMSDLLEIEKESQEGALPEQCQWQVDAIIERYAMIFMGISPVQQELLW